MQIDPNISLNSDQHTNQDSEKTQLQSRITRKNSLCNAFLKFRLYSRKIGSKANYASHEMCWAAILDMHSCHSILCSIAGPKSDSQSLQWLVMIPYLS